MVTVAAMLKKVLYNRAVQSTAVTAVCLTVFTVCWYQPWLLLWWAIWAIIAVVAVVGAVRL